MALERYSFRIIQRISTSSRRPLSISIFAPSIIVVAVNKCFINSLPERPIVSRNSQNPGNRQLFGVRRPGGALLRLTAAAEDSKMPQAAAGQSGTRRPHSKELPPFHNNLVSRKSSPPFNSHRSSAAAWLPPSPCENIELSRALCTTRPSYLKTM